MIPATIVANKYTPTMLPSIQVKCVIGSLSFTGENETRRSAASQLPPVLVAIVHLAVRHFNTV
jgi:hypothetical protein